MSLTSPVNLSDSAHWTVPHVVLTQAEQHPDRTAIEFTEYGEWTFSDCKNQALKAAGLLAAKGIKAGDIVALMTDNAEEFCRYWLGLNFIGATMVAINTSMRGAPLQHQIQISATQFLIVDEKTHQECNNLQNTVSVLLTNELQLANSKPLPLEKIHPTHSHDLSCVMFTSGTSGPSKGVLMPQAHCLLFAIGTIENYNLKSTDTFYICLPLFHANGLFMQLLACLAIGCKAVIRDKFSASRWLDDIRHYRITHTNTLGAVAAFIVAQPETDHDKDHTLRVIGAAPLPAMAEEIFRNRFGVPSVVPLYGMTEVNIPLYGKLNESAPGTCGYVYDKYFQVEIRNPDSDDPVADGTTGEIMVRPKLANGFMSGYVGMPEATLQSWRNFWFHTGDAGYKNPLGQFVFVDRIKDCIRKRGENISSYEVEQAFLGIDEIAEVAAYAVPAEGGEGMEDEVMVAILLKQNASIDIEQWVNSASSDIPKFAIPRYVRVVKELPKTQTGKIRKIELRNDGITPDTVDRQLG